MHSQNTPGRRGEPLGDERSTPLENSIHIRGNIMTATSGQDDSIAAQLIEQNAERVSAADDVFESHQRFSATNMVHVQSAAQQFQQQQQQQQYSSVSEGVASAGHPPFATLDRMGEFVPGEIGYGNAGGLYEGETSGMHEPVGGSNLYVDADTNTPTVTHGPQRRNSAHQVLSPMDMGGRGRKSIDDLMFGDLEGNESTGGLNSGGVHQVSSEMAMVMGLSDGENEGPQRRPKRTSEPTDSNVGCIMYGLGNNANATGDYEIAQHQASASFKDRPSDADIIAWENQIREKEANKSLLIGNKISLESLLDEYEKGSDVFKAKIASLSSVYGSMRRSRGDGNCFFRSFIFSYLEHLLETGDKEERNRMTTVLSSLQNLLLKSGYEELVVEGPMELLLGLLGSFQDSSDPLTVERLESNMRSEEISNYIVFLLRIITSAEVKDKADFFAPFIIGLTDMPVEEFCNRCIDPMGEESDHVQLVALTNALKVPVRVIYLDGSASMQMAGAHATSVDGLYADAHDFIPEGCSATSDDIQVHLLYRPGHYDILYKL